MLINEANYLGINLRPYAKNIITNWLSVKHPTWTEEDYKKREDIITNFFKEGDEKPYLITKKALQDIELIKLGENFDFTLLSGIKEQKNTYLINNNLCFRFYIDGDNLRVLCIRKTPLDNGQVWLDYAIFYCNTISGNIVSDSKFENEINLFLKCLIFVEIAESELIFVNSGQKIGSKKEGYYNLLPSKVILVNSNWNKIIVRTEGFAVSGHFRLQRVGKNRGEVKLIWIEPYTKSGYVKMEGKNNSR